MERIYNEHVRLNEKEENELLRLCAVMRCSKSKVLRSLLLYKICYGEPPVEYGKMLAVLRRIGVNLNQIARALNENGIVNPNDLKQALNDLYACEHTLNEKCRAKCEVLF